MLRYFGHNGRCTSTNHHLDPGGDDDWTTRWYEGIFTHSGSQVHERDRGSPEHPSSCLLHYLHVTLVCLRRTFLVSVERPRPLDIGPGTLYSILKLSDTPPVMSRSNDPEPPHPHMLDKSLWWGCYPGLGYRCPVLNPDFVVLSRL